MALLALLIPFGLLGGLLVLGRYEEVMLSPAPEAEPEVSPR